MAFYNHVKLPASGVICRRAPVVLPIWVLPLPGMHF